MTLLVLPLVSLVAAGLTLFSGFGLGTLLTPAFAFFFPIELAVGLTAIVHLANNLFKLALLGRHADRRTLLLFAVPAVFAAFLGAEALARLSSLPPLCSYSLGSRLLQVTPVKAVVSSLILAFVALELSPRFASLQLPPRFLPLGGLLSGFFGGLSGHQGALRSVFLLKAGLSKESFIATGVVIACLIDVTRLSVYSRHLSLPSLSANLPLLLAAISSAFAGSFLGARLLHKVTLRFVQLTVSLALVLISLALFSGLI